MNPVLVALDTRSAEEAVRLAESVADFVGGFKVGLRLLLGPGPAVIASLSHLDKPVLADAKLHDIPTQVEAAARRLGEYGARWITAHVMGGRHMLEAARAGLQQGNGDGGVLGVTVLTSLDDRDLADLVSTGSAAKLVSRLSRVAQSAGCEGVVCSPRELSNVAQVAPGLIRITPGIRGGPASTDDQSRTATAADALSWGADWIVVGRPIVAAPDPRQAASDLAEMVSASR